MILIRFMLADLRRKRIGAAIIILLVALATALGIAINLQERALRIGSARAADRFDLVIGAPGSETQLILSSVFLQPSPLPLLQGDVLKKLSEDPRVAWAAPVGFGDSYEGIPIVGTTAEFSTDKGRLPMREGRIFRTKTEAVIGAHVDMRQGSIVKPLHGLPGEGGHTHNEMAFTVVGRMAETGTPWDRAILVPIESIWEIHDLHPAHANDEEVSHHHDEASPDTKLGAPWPQHPPGIPALIVKPATFADAYKLRAEYRKNGTLAVFPAEVLTRLYGTLGDARSILTLIALGTQVMMAIAIVFISIIHIDQRRRQIASLRAFGAPRAGIFAIVWTELMLLIGTGITAGVLLGYLAAATISAVMMQKSGIVLPVMLVRQDAFLLLGLLAGAATFALLPALIACRQPPSLGLRS